MFKMLGAIPRRRLLIYLLSLGLIPIGAAIAFNASEANSLQEALQRVTCVHDQAVSWQQKQVLNTLTRKCHAEADHYYVDKYLEAISLCQKEASELSRLIEEDPSLPNRELLKRLEHLEGQENQPRFIEGMVESHAQIRETLEKLSYPVEVAKEDLPLILARVEGVAIGEHSPGPAAPQILVTEFKLQRKKVQGDNEVFLLDLQFIRREFS